MATDYNTINDLRINYPVTAPTGSFPVAGSIAFIKGYSLNGDGGEGYFYWDNACIITDNDGTVIDSNPATNPPAAGRWVRMFEDVIQVKWFGAKGDGTGNDAKPINAAISFSNSYANNKQIYFAPGVYCLAATIQLYSGTYLKGDQRTSVSFTTLATASPVVTALSASMLSDIVIENISFNGFQVNFSIDRVNNITFNNVGVNNFGYPTITNLKSGIYLKGCKNVIIQNCHIDTTGEYGIRVDGGCTAVGTCDDPSQDILITSNFITNSSDTGISVCAQFGSVVRPIVTNNHITNVGKSAISFAISTTTGLTFTDGVISNNIIFNWGLAGDGYAIELNTATSGGNISNCTVTGNSIRTSASYNEHQLGYVNAINLNCATITGNSCFAGETKTGIGGVKNSGFGITNVNEVTITGNVVEFACRGEISTGINAGILLNISKNITLTGNIIRNTGKYDVTAPVNRPAIHLKGTKNCSINGNICYDDQLSSDTTPIPTPSQSRGIEEEIDSRDNFFGNNSSYGNKYTNIYSNGSIVYDSMPVQNIPDSGDTASTTMATHTTFVILSPLSTADRTLTLVTPSILPGNILNYGTLTIWNQNPSTNSNIWRVRNNASPAVSDIIDVGSTPVDSIPKGSVTILNFDGLKWIKK